MNGPDALTNIEEARKVIEGTRRRWRRVRFLEALLAFGALLFAAALLGFAADNLFSLPGGFRTLYLVLAAGIGGWALIRGVRRAFRLTALEAALLLERRNPGIDNRLVNALLLSRDPNSAGSPFIPLLWRDAASALRGTSLIRPIAHDRMKRLLIAAAASGALLLVYGLLLPEPFRNAALRFTRPGAFVPPLSRFTLSVSPGDVRLPAGSPLVIEAAPGKEVPPSVLLACRTGDGLESMSMTYAGGIFVHRFDRVDRDFIYTVSAGDFESRPFQVRAVHAPRPGRFRMRFDYPAYTGLVAETIETDSGDIETLSGTRVTLEVFPDRPADRAWMLLDGGERLDLVRSPEDSFIASLDIRQDADYALVLADPSGIEDPGAPRYSITALKDAPPSVRIAAPGRDLVLPAAEEVPVLIEADDDIGLSRIRLLRWIPGSGGSAQAVVDGDWTFEAGVRVARAAGALRLAVTQEASRTAVQYRALAEDRAGNTAESEPFRIWLMPGRSEPELRGDRVESGYPAEAVGAVRETVEILTKFAKEQRILIEATRDLMKVNPEDYTQIETEAVEKLERTEAEWSEALKSLSDDYDKLNPQDFSDASLSEELVELYSEVELAADALDRQAVEIAVPLEQTGLELAEELTANLERWLSDVADHRKWIMEDPLEDYEVPLAELPAELEDIVGDLIDSEEAMTGEVEDLTSGWLDSLDEGAGWTVADGPISNMSARGITGNLLPNTQEVGGRSGEGRSGRSHGQMVETAAEGKGGRQTPTRTTPDPFEAGKVRDASRDPEGGATGGGKLSGSGPEGLRGNVPPDVKDRMDRLAGRQAGIRQTGEALRLAFANQGYYPEDLERAIEIMKSMENALGNRERRNYIEGQRLILDRLTRFKAVAAASIRFDRERRAGMPEALRAALQSAFGEAAPEEYRDLISRYYRSLAETGER